ncbi:MAG: bifunctional methionine sulfoxide reductase B/A protein [Phaeodactylibacter sp.]|nr:bifunctional methionine sulfoxide reductase B/A protein [Phaeodactylibacter sp.]MCB9272908.1 bifunctional methionine sulfoxide reductase B/A protein [Lewinellaceae bacterium]
MLNWLDVIKFAKNGNPKPSRRVEKTEEEWKALLAPEQFRIMRQKGTERAFTGEHCSIFEPALYGCACCGNWLFDSREKFESGTGWPSFTQPVTENAIQYELDHSFGMRRVEVMCNVCDAHLGHVFPDGPMPSGLRYCINSASLKKVSTTGLRTATFAGGCFWCTEAIFSELKGVENVLSGYSGGTPETATYEQVCSGTTGHAEAVQVVFNQEEISYESLVRMHLLTHDPTTPNRQGADRGPQYRSAIFYHDDEQKAAAEIVIAELDAEFDDPIVTELTPFEAFYRAEEYHQEFYSRNPANRYCVAVISPKLQKLRVMHSEKLKAQASN